MQHPEPKAFETHYNRLSSLKMIKLDYDGAVHGPNEASSVIIDYDHVHQWQNGPTTEEIVNNRILQSE